MIDWLFAPLMSPVPIPSPDCLHTATTLKCVQVVRVYDGDTFTVNIPGVHPWMGKEIGVRVNGVDTPEIGGELPCEKKRAEEARLVTSNFLAQGRPIELRGIGREKFGRILADVFIGRDSLKDELLIHGVADPYDGGEKKRKSWCRR